MRGKDDETLIDTGDHRVLWDNDLDQFIVADKGGREIFYTSKAGEVLDWLRAHEPFKFDKIAEALLVADRTVPLKVK